MMMVVVVVVWDDGLSYGVEWRIDLVLEVCFLVQGKWWGTDYYNYKMHSVI